MDSHHGSVFSRVDYYLSNLALNYAYRTSDRFQVGAFYEGIHTEYKFRKQGGGKAPMEVEQNTLGIFTLYNFHDDLKDSLYLGVAFSVVSYEEENSHDFASAEGKSAIELDDNSEVYEIILGRRFPLGTYKLEYLSFSPQVRLYFKTHGKDFDDQEIRNGWGVNFQPVRFDLIF